MQTKKTNPEESLGQLTFSGNIFIFFAFDVGDDINLEKIEKIRALKSVPLSLPKYFKNYHLPLAIELPHPHKTSHCISCKIHNFGVISLTYKIPFTDTLEDIRKYFREISNNYQEQSVLDTKSIFKKIRKCIVQPKFFQTQSSYIMIQVDPQPKKINLTQLQKQYGNAITSMLRFETKALADYQKNIMLESAIGYFRGDLVIIDTDVAFVYDDEYNEILDLFEFANIQQLELRFFDRLLDRQLNVIYEGEVSRLPLRAYLPFLGTVMSDPIAQLGKLKADISVITERLESSVKLAGEPYLSELYEELVDKLDLKSWQDGINRKLKIIEDIQTVYQHKIDVNREDMLTILIIVLIFIELVIGILHYINP